VLGVSDGFVLVFFDGFKLGIFDGFVLGFFLGALVFLGCAEGFEVETGFLGAGFILGGAGFISTGAFGALMSLGCAEGFVTCLLPLIMNTHLPLSI